MSDLEFEIGLDDFEDLYSEAGDLLEQATSFSQIGKLHTFTKASVYDKPSNSFREVSAKEWKEYDGFKLLNLYVQVDTKEFKPELERGYERRVQVRGTPWNRKEADGKYTRIPGDWEAIFEPSLFAVTGLNDATKALKALEGKYVRVLDVKQQPTKKQPEPTYNTAKLAEVYDSREAAYGAFLASKSSQTATPTGEAEANFFAEEVVEAVKTLAKTGMSADVIAKSLGGVSPSDVAKILGA